jgi:hypothetical protein
MGAPNRKHVGILVIHDMGDENPYGPLDQSARGLYWHYRSNRAPASSSPPTKCRRTGANATPMIPLTCRVRGRKRKSASSAVLMRMSPYPKVLRLPSITGHPPPKGKIKDLAVLTWLIRIALEPFRYLNENSQVMSQAAKAGRSSETIGDERAAGASILIREIFRLALIYPFLLLSFIAVAAFLHHLPDLASLFINIPSHGPELWWALLIVARLLILGSLAG